ncbi:hypothetical protein CB1_001484016 [Camelus ferus]|nr:hypothetical protein CB1_001484016 [Camelus ferus]
MLSHKRSAISSVSRSHVMGCAVGKAVCSLLMMAVGSGMKPSREGCSGPAIGAQWACLLGLGPQQIYTLKQEKEERKIMKDRGRQGNERCYVPTEQMMLQQCGKYSPRRKTMTLVDDDKIGSDRYCGFFRAMGQNACHKMNILERSSSSRIRYYSRKIQSKNLKRSRSQSKTSFPMLRPYGEMLVKPFCYTSKAK